MNNADISRSLKTQCHIGQEMMRLESPPSAMTHHVVTPSSNVITALPYYNVVIPVMDNFGGPINMSASLSVDPLGSDLPLHG